MTANGAHLNEANAKLTSIERLLSRAIEDLIGQPRSAPGANCREIMVQVQTEFQQLSRFVSLHGFARAERTRLEVQLKSLMAQLRHVERLWGAAAQFYCGWCAAGFNPPHPIPGYVADEYAPGPVLLAFEG